MHLGNIIVTGGMGFIGSHFIHHILQNEGDCDAVFNIDYIGYGSNPNNLNDLDDNVKYRHVKADINDIESAIADINRINVIVNFAAETHVDRSIANPVEFVHSNVNGVLSLLEYCRLHDVNKFIHISTDEVYGDATGQGHLNEDYPLKPNSPYSASKASADMLVRAYNKTYGLDARITRCSNNFGPNQFPEKLIPKTIIRALKGLPIPIYGDGRQTREWLYVKDHVRAILKVIDVGKSGQIYNISSSNEISNIELVGKIIDTLNKKGIRTEIEHVPDRPAHDKRYAIDSSKIRKELGWKPIYLLNEALNETILWYLENKWWWEPLVTDAVIHPQPWKLNWKK